MNKNSRSISPPTLMEVPAHSTPRMLSSLDGDKANPRKKKRGRSPVWFVVLAMLGAGVAIGGTVLIAHTVSHGVNHGVTASVKPAKNPDSNIVAISVPKTAAAAENINPAVENTTDKAATIISDQPQPAPKADVQAKSSNDPHDRLSAALEGNPLAPQAKSKQGEETKAEAKAKSTQAVKKKETAHQKSHNSAHAKTNESEVKLLAALVASANQDVVERRPGETTASLLKRCKKLGSLEGQLCSERICSGHWQKDPACAPVLKAKESQEENKGK